MNNKPVVTGGRADRLRLQAVQRSSRAASTALGLDSGILEAAGIISGVLASVLVLVRVGGFGGVAAAAGVVALLYWAYAEFVAWLVIWLQLPVSPGRWEKLRSTSPSAARSYPTNQEYWRGRWAAMEQADKSQSTLAVVKPEKAPKRGADVGGAGPLIHGALLFVSAVFQRLAWTALAFAIVLLGYCFFLGRHFPVASSGFAALPDWIAMIPGAGPTAEMVRQLNLLQLSCLFLIGGFVLSSLEWTFKRLSAEFRRRWANSNTVVTPVIVVATLVSFFASIALFLLVGYWFVFAAEFNADISIPCCTQPFIDALQVLTDPTGATDVLRFMLGKPLLMFAGILIVVDIAAEALISALSSSGPLSPHR